MSNQYHRAIEAFIESDEAATPVIFGDLSDRSDVDLTLLYNDMIMGFGQAIEDMGLFGKVCIGLNVDGKAWLFLMKTPTLKVPYPAAIVLEA